MIGRVVAEYRRAGSGNRAFIVTHDPNSHAPYGLHRVYTRGRELGRQLSLPTSSDCERMLNPPPPRIVPPLPGYTAATKARQARLKRDGTPYKTYTGDALQDDFYGRLLLP